MFHGQICTDLYDITTSGEGGGCAGGGGGGADSPVKDTDRQGA